MARDGDTDITDRFDDLLALQEQRMYYGAREVPGLLPAFEPIRIPEMETSSSAFALGDPVAQPTGFLELIGGTLTSPVQPIEIIDQSMIDNYGGETTGQPMLAVSGTNLRYVGPATTDTCTLRYYAKLTSPSGSNSTNWILTYAPGVYLNGCLMQAAILTQDADAAKMYAALYASEVGGLNERRNRQLWAARDLKIRLRVSTP